MNSYYGFEWLWISLGIYSYTGHSNSKNCHGLETRQKGIFVEIYLYLVSSLAFAKPCFKALPAIKL